MANKITYTITTSDGKSHQVSKENINKYGMAAYADAYKGATVRMRDKDKGDYDIPIEHYNDAIGQGLHPFSIEYLPSKPAAKPAAPKPATPKPAAPATPQPKQKDRWKPSAEDMARFNQTVADVNRTVQQGVQRIKAIGEYGAARLKDPFGTSRFGARIGEKKQPTIGKNRNVVRGKDQYNARTGKFEPTYITEGGETFNNRALADAEQDRIDRERAPIETQLQEAYAERDRLNERLGQIGKEEDKKNDTVLSGLASASNVTGGNYYYSEELPHKRDMNPEYRQLHAAAEQNRQRIVALEAERDKGNSNFWNGWGFWRGAKDAFTDPTLWDFGYTDAISAQALLSAANRKGRKSKAETNADDALLEAAYKNQQAQDKYASNRNAMYRFGQIGATSIPFMLDFMLMGGSNSFGKMGARAGIKAAEKLGLEGIKKTAMKYTGTALSELAAANLMSNTLQGGTTGEDIVHRGLGQVVQGEDGSYKFAGGEDWGKAIYKGQMAATLENYTEMLGEHLAGKVIGGKVLQGLDRMGLSKVSDIFRRVGSSHYAQAANKVLNKGGFNGYLNEVAEEEANIILNAALVGDNKLSDLVDGRQQLDIWGGLLFSCGAMEAVPKAIGAADYYRNKRSVGKADRVAGFHLTQEKWEPLRSEIDQTDNNDMAAMAEKVINDDSLERQEKEAVLDYMGKLIKFRGFNTATAANSKEKAENGGESEDDKVEQGLNSAYMQGHDASDGQKNDIKTRYEYATQQLEQAGWGKDLIDNKPPASILKYMKLEQFPEEKIQAVLDYYNAKSAYDGMIQGVRDNIEDAIEESDQTVNGRVHNDDAMIHPATMKQDDRKVYIIGGNVQMTDDGTMVDTSKSDESVIIRDAETGKIEFADPSQILSIDEPIDAEQEKQAAAEAIRQEYAQREGDMIDGVLPFKPGDEYNVLDEQGQQHTVQVVGEAVDEKGQPIEGAVTVMYDGQQAVLPKQQIQQMSDADNMARLNASLQQREAAKQEEAARQQAEAQPLLPFALNDEFTLQTPDGRTVRGSVQSEQNANGLVEVYTEEPVKGKARVDLFTPEELQGMITEYNGEQVEQPKNVTQEDTETAGNIPLPKLTPQEYHDKINSLLVIENASQEFVDGAVAEEFPIAVDYFNGRIDAKDALLRVGYVEDTVKNYMTDERAKEEADERLGGYKPYMTEPVETNSEDNSLQDIQENAHEPVTAENEEQMSQQSEFESEQPETEPMPMTKDKNGEDTGEPDWQAVTPQRGHSYIYNESGLPRDVANQLVNNNLADAQKKLETLKKKQPKIGTSIAKYNSDLQKWQEQQQTVKATADYWTAVKAEQNKVLAAEQKQQAEINAAKHDEAVEQERLRKEAEAKAAAERAAVGNENPMPQITERWNAAPKMDGVKDEIVLPNGEKVMGHYVLTESGAASPSHNALNGFQKTEGFPMDENGGTVNDRDYERDADAQRVTRAIAGNYDSRALQTPVVVSQDGVVLSGNGRTMAGELAAYDNTDTAYNDYVRQYAQKYGFSPEQVGQMQHPRIVFVPDERMPYSADTFAKFNQQEMKSQSKTEQAVKMGKIVNDSTFGRIVRSINKFDTLGDFYNDPKATNEAVKELQSAGVITPQQVAEMYDGDGISAIGREILENTLIGKAFENNPDAVRMITEFKSMRQSIITALSEIANNLTLGKKFSLENELSEAVKLCYEARKDGKYKVGDKVSGYARQGLLFGEEGETVADYRNATIMMLADILNDPRISQLKKTLAIYNNGAADSAKGLADIFTGKVRGKEEIIKDVLNLLNNGTAKEQQAAVEAGVERRKTDGVRENGSAGTGNQESGEAEGRRYSVSDIDSDRGGNFYQDENGNINLVDIPKEIFDKINIPPLPFRLTTSMAKHVYEQHSEELGLDNVEEAVEFVVDVMHNVDHVRAGNNGAFIFSVEDGRMRIGKRAIAIVVNAQKGDFLGIRTSGYDRIKSLKERPLFWEKRANETSTTGVAPANVTSEPVSRSDEPVGSTSNQDKDLSENKGTEVPANDQEKTENSTANKGITTTNSTEYTEKSPESKYSFGGVNGRIYSVQGTYEGEASQWFVKIGRNVLTLCKDRADGERIFKMTVDVMQNLKGKEWTEDGETMRCLPDGNLIQITADGRSRITGSLTYDAAYVYAKAIERGRIKPEPIGTASPSLAKEQAGDVPELYKIWRSSYESHLKKLIESEPYNANNEASLRSLVGQAIGRTNVGLGRWMRSSDTNEKKQWKEYEKWRGQNPISSEALEDEAIKKYLPKTGQQTAIQEAEQQVDTNPTNAQKEAGNYKKGHLKLDGYDITIEQPKGSIRSGKDADGKEWQSEMHNTYGYIRGTEGVDGDHIDVFLSDNPTEGYVYVIDQVNPKTGEFDEHKVMYGFKSALAAKNAYLSNYEKDWAGLGKITKVSKEDFKKWINSSHRKTKPFSEYTAIKQEVSDRYNVNDLVELNDGGNFVIHNIRTNKDGSVWYQGRYVQHPKYGNKNSAMLPERIRGLAPKENYKPEDSNEDIFQKAERIAEATVQKQEAKKKAKELYSVETIARELAKDKELKIKFNAGNTDDMLNVILRDEVDGYVVDTIEKNYNDKPLLDEIVKESDAFEAERKNNHGVIDDIRKTIASIYANENVQEETYGGIKRSEMEAALKDIANLLLGKGPNITAGLDMKTLLEKGGVVAKFFVCKGAVRFADFSKQVYDTMSKISHEAAENLKPYLKKMYMQLQGDETMDEAILDKMDDARTVRAYDLTTLGKLEGKSGDVFEKAEQIANETKVEQEAKKNLRPETDEDLRSGKTVYHKGKPRSSHIIVDKGEQVGPAQFSKPYIETVYFHDGSSAKVEDLLVMDDVKPKANEEKDNQTHQNETKGTNHNEGTLPDGSFKVDEKALMAAAQMGITVSPRDFAIGLPPTQHRINIGLAGAIAANSEQDFWNLRKNLEAKGYKFDNDMWNALHDMQVGYVWEVVDIPGMVEALDAASKDKTLPKVEWPKNSNDVSSLDNQKYNDWNEAKAQHPDHLVLVKNGDFYETYNEDAAKLRDLADVTLTQTNNRGKITSFAGFPLVGADNYNSLLERKGQKVTFVGNNENEENKSSLKETKPVVPKKPTSSQLDLFGNVEQETNNNDNGKEEVQLQTGTGTAKREERHEPRPDEPLGKSKSHEAKRPDRTGMARRDRGNTMPDTERSSGLLDSNKGKQYVEKPPKKNLRNNHAERGINYAPRGENARIEANLKAIETMQRLVESGEEATPKDMEILRRFSGWGGLGAAFREGDSWNRNPVNQRLQSLLTSEQYEAANMARNSAYYTPAEIIDNMWDVARAMGFKGGNVLEGSAGIGNIIGQMPADMSSRSNIHAVEIDDVTGQILKLLYPDAQVDIQGFEQTKIPNGSVDLAITNVPFVTDLKVHDESGDKDLSYKFRDIHDFCIAKNIRKLREGGIGIFITSSGTLDKSQKLRNWIVNEGNADVVGAFRLNNKTFGGTGVTSDIVVVRKRINGKKSANAIDVNETKAVRTVEYDDGEGKKNSEKRLALDYNQYYVEHPENMAGEMAFNFEKGVTFHPTSVSLFPTTGTNQLQMLSDWTKQFTDKDWEAATLRKEEDTSVIYENLGEDVKEGSMLLDKNGKLCLAQRGKAVPLNVNDKKVKGHTKAECFTSYKDIKDALSDVLQYQTEHEDDNGLRPLLDKLNKAYDDFVNTYGHLNKNVVLSFLRNDMDFPSIAALESVSETGDKSGKRVVTYKKTDIFEHRVVEKESAPKPTNIRDGIIASIYLNGRVDVPYISEQLGKPDTEVRNEIVKDGLGFENPVTNEMEVSYEYLSGNVREKLQQAKDNNADGRYSANIRALERIIPNDVPMHLIEFTLGSSWVESKLYEDYVKERTDLDVKLVNTGGTWLMQKPYYIFTVKNKTMGIISDLCDKTIFGHELIEAALQNKTINVTKTQKDYNGRTETITDKDATLACANKIDEIREDFKSWARNRMQADPEMAERMVKVYNDKFNNYVPKSIPDEFIPEHFGGAARVVNGKRFQLRPHQAKAVILATTQPTMLAHEVGTGKTYTLISTAMEMRRLGTARKPMIVVQNATVGQFVASAKSLYPNAKILTLEDADRNAEGRKNFYAKIRYNDWDMIVVPQSVFERIPDSPEREARFIQDKIEEKMRVLEQMREADGNGSNLIIRRAEKEIEDLQDYLNNLKVSTTQNKQDTNEEKLNIDRKREAKSRKNAEVKAKEMLDREKDDTLNFDDMGIDALLVDEAHEYKHLGFATAMQRGVKGVDSSYSKKSQGVYLKTQAVLEKNNGRNVVFATGTPISNTAAEIWTFMRYLMPADTMRKYDIYYFDDFVRNFGQIQQVPEFGASGKYKEVNRFLGYVNLPELVRIWNSVADTVRTQDAGGVNDKIPEMDGGKAQDVFLPQTKALRSVMKFVKEQLAKFEQMSGKEKKAHSYIPLTMYGIAKAAAVDARLVVDNAPDEPNSKTNETVRQTLKSLEATKEYNGTVAIFSDNYQNKRSGFNLYEDIRKKLIDAGVPADQIVIMKSGMSVKKKLDIFDRVNRGEVRVIMGSTFTLGTGVNIQERLNTLIHVDAPVRPMDYTQRNGRILRQGNLHKEWGIPVKVLRFGVEDSLDVTAYQRLKTKGAIADSIMNGKKLIANNMENRILEEEQDIFGDITAQLSGSQYALLKNQVEKELKKLQNRKEQWEQQQIYIHNMRPRLQGLIKSAESRKEDLEDALSKVEATHDHNITIGKLTFDSIEAMGEYIKSFNKKQREIQESVKNDRSDNASQIRNVTINVGGIDFFLHSVISKEIGRGTNSQMTLVSRTLMQYSCPTLGLKDVAVKGQQIRTALEDIVQNVMTGKNFKEKIEYAETSIQRNTSELAMLEKQDGKPFEDADKLEKAKEKFKEYDELMRKELAEKEAKYAEMDSEVETAKDVNTASEDEEDGEDDTKRYRLGDPAETFEARQEAAVANHGTVMPGLNESSVEVTDVPRHKYKGTAVQAKQQAIADALKKYIEVDEKGEEKPKVQTYSNYGQTFDYTISGNSVDESMNKKAIMSSSNMGAHIAVLNELPKVINNSIEVEEHPDYMKDEHGVRTTKKVNPNVLVHVFYGAINISGETYRVKTTMKENENPEVGNTQYSYKVTNVELLADESTSSSNGVGDTYSEMSSGNHPLAKLLQGVEKSYDKGKKLLDESEDLTNGDRFRTAGDEITDEKVSYENDPWSKMLGSSYRTPAQKKAFAERTRGQMKEKVHSMVNILGIADNVEIVTDASGLNGKERKAKGWYDRKTGKITIVVPNHVSVADIEQTVLHEAVAHYGLRKLFGKNFDNFLDNVFNNADVDIRRKIVEMAAKKGWDFHTATEEYLAGLAEDTEFENVNASWWSKIKHFFLRMLHDLGLTGTLTDEELTDNELRYILWRSYENLKEPGRDRNVFQQAEDISMQNKLKVGNYAVRNEEQGSSVADSDKLYRDAEDRDRVTVRNEYEREIAGSMYQFQEAMQDSMLGLKTLMNKILKASGQKEAADFENAYMAENALSSKNKAEADAYKNLVMKPLLDAVAALKKEDVTQGEITDYMMAKHGLERNALMRERAKQQLINEKFGDSKPKEPNIDDDDYDDKMAAYTHKLDEWEEMVNEELGDKLEALDNRDYSGLTALTGEEDTGAAETVAQEMVDEFESGHDTKELWDKVNAATKATLSKIYESGLLSKDRYEQIRDMYQNYIPLRGWDDTTSDKVYGYLMSKDGAMRGSIMKRAGGRSSKADDPVATIAAMAEAAINQGNRNLMKQKFLNFALNHPSDAISVNGLWLKHDDVTDDWTPVFADLDTNDDAATVERKINDFEDKMKSLSEEEPDKYKYGKEAIGIPYIVKPGNLNEHQVLVQRGGKTYVLTINGNPRAAQALNGLTNPNVEMEGAIGNMLKAGEYVNRQMSAFYTTRNPNFVASNFIRDALYANSMVWVKESPNYALRYHKNFAKYNPTVLGYLLNKYEKGKLDMGNKTEQMFYQFMMNGGETGYTVQRDVEAHKRTVRKEIANRNSRIPLRKALSLLGERFDDVNRSVENCARFAAFATSRELGRSVERAVWDAKEISVNFNKKGSGSKFLNAKGQTKLGQLAAFTSGGGRVGYVFWNAAIQGTYNFGKSVKQHPGKGLALMAATFLLGALIPQLGGDGDGDDDKNYYNLPEFVRRSNICFRVGDKWCTIPLSVEMRAMYGLGELATSVMTGNEKLTSGELAVKIAEQLSQTMPLDFMEGGGGLSAAIPSSVKPVAEVWMNKDWTGLPIYKDTPFNKNMPEWTKAYSRTNLSLIQLSKVLNEWSGGDDYKKGNVDINPAVIEHLLEGAFGGISTTINQMQKSAETISGEREFDWRNIPIASRIVKNADERTQMRSVNDKYFKYRDEFNETKRLLKEYEDAADEGVLKYAEKLDFLNNSKQMQLYEVMEDYMEDINDLQEDIKDTDDDKERKELQAEQDSLKVEMVEALRQLDEKQ